MLKSVLGKKVGMTQIFDKDGNVVPVTVVDVGNWFVTQVKTAEKDGYSSLQLGLPRKRYRGESFSPAWLKSKKDYFLHLKEVSLDVNDKFDVGQEIKLDQVLLQDGEKVSVTGTSRGLGFQGVVKRHNFKGGPKAHGSKFHRRPGALSSMRTQGEVFKGKRLPGHMGFAQVTVKGLKVVQINKDSGHVLLKGTVPGKKDSLVFINKQGK
jgi:large subunit ribosomal protein L3